VNAIAKRLGCAACVAAATMLAPVTMITLSGCASTPTRESTGEYVDDSTITAKVKADLVKDPVVSALQVSVETYKGVVQLSGFVNSQEQSQRAEDIAKGVAGVKQVKNNLVVKTSSN
jgi:osmotically-inducible protein OsmY